MSEHKTRNGTPITFRYLEDVEGDENRGWIVHALVAEVDGQEVGYLQISYIPRERFKSNYPSLLHFMRKIRGWCIGDDFESLSTLDLNKRIAGYLGDMEAMNVGYNGIEPTDEWVAMKRKELFARMERKYRPDFREFERYHVDNPIVDFVRVYGEHEIGREAKFSDQVVTQGYRRQAIGTALYLEATRWMNELGMELFASGCQSDYAKAVWNTFEQRFDVGKKRIKSSGKFIYRRYLKLPSRDTVAA